MPAPYNLVILIICGYHGISIHNLFADYFAILILNLLVSNVECKLTRLGVVAAEIDQTHAAMPQHRCRRRLNSRVALGDVRQIDNVTRILLR